MSKKVYMLFGDGVEEIELAVPVDILRRCRLDVILVSAKKSLHVLGAHEMKLTADEIITNLQVDDFDCLLLPGGPGAFMLQENSSVLTLVRSFHEKNKLICAICAAPLILHRAGILDSKKYCSHPCTYDILKNADQNARTMVDGNLITAKGPGAVVEFAMLIVERLCGALTASNIKEEMLFQ
ncbi:MAG: DJ-1/PfpI family protein [Puniceicoccales bacterium]|nr:DJ-1/PfpI family protein [Puniceicoccales bacterium]